MAEDRCLRRGDRLTAEPGTTGDQGRARASHENRSSVQGNAGKSHVCKTFRDKSLTVMYSNQDTQECFVET